ncbi:hypothetical protein RHSIM_Rhsim07G0038700 [Rhododendron simsii]|uniref:Alpha-1,4 glucan phosphorylase n=1 Tax=Rhododendron simsii TaxID=118357 RepID=A0A834GKL6_RHOSS|nr:hypothetical protein RHSIM_Rhsim07G0038700 [Rhododendron simsii]
MNGMIVKGFPVYKVAFTVLLYGCFKMGDIPAAQSLWEEMERRGMSPDAVAFSAIIDGLSKAGLVEEAYNLFLKMSKKGYVPNNYAYNSLIGGFVICVRLSEELKLEKEMRQRGLVPDVFTINIIINGFCKQGRMKSAVDTFHGYVLDEIDTRYCYLQCFDQADRSDSSQYRKSGGRSRTSAQPRTFSGGSGKGGGGPAPPLSSTSTNSSLSSNRSFKKHNNAQGGQSRVSSVGVNPDSSYASAARTLQNCTHLQPSAQVFSFRLVALGAADAPVAGVPLKPTTYMAAQKSTQAGPKAPSSQPAIVNSDSTPPATSAKPSGEASKSFPLQFGSISPGFENGMQLGNLGISIGSPFAQHQAGNYVVQRIPVKITHPDTHEELRLGGSSGTSSQAPRFSYPPSQSTQTPAFVNPSAHNSCSYSSKISALLHGGSESSSLEHSRGVHSAMSSALPASAQVTIKQATGLSVEKIADSSQVVSSASIEKGETPTIIQQPGEDGLFNLQSNSDTSQHPKRSLEPMSSSVTAAVKESTAASPSVDAPLEKSAPIVTNSTENRRQTISRADSIKDQQKKQIKKGFSLPHHQAPVSAFPSVSERALESEGEGTEYVYVGLVSRPAAASKDKPVVELSRSKSNVSKGKKKRKEILQKADALGTTSDLYMACKGPEEKNETVASLECTTSASSVASKQEFVDTTQDDVILKKGQQKLEPNDWEDADDFSTPRLEAMDDGKQVHGGLKHHSDDGNGVMTKKYSRDFLLKFSEQFSELPESLESTSDIAEALMAANLIASRESHPSVQRNTPDSDRWQRASSFQKGLIPSPQTPLQVMHKAKKKYEVGKVTDEEVVKQRQLKAILNKLTPQNFEKLFEQVNAARVIGQANMLYEEMRNAGVPPDSVTFNILVARHYRYGREEDGDRLLRDLSVFGLLLDSSLSDISVAELCWAGRLDAAIGMQEEMLDKGMTVSLIAFNSVIAAYSSAWVEDRAFEAYELMMGVSKWGTFRLLKACGRKWKRRGMSPDAVAFSAIIDGLSKAGLVEEAYNVFLKMSKKGFVPNNYAYNSLIGGFVNCCRLSEALKLDKEMRQRDLVHDVFTINIIINGFNKQGRMKSAVDTFMDMYRMGLTPDIVTYNTLISGYCKAIDMVNLDNFGRNCMPAGVVPNTVTYNTMMTGVCNDILDTRAAREDLDVGLEVKYRTPSEKGKRSFELTNSGPSRSCNVSIRTPAKLVKVLDMATSADANGNTKSGLSSKYAKIPAVAHPMAEESAEIASDISYHAQYSPHFSPFKFELERAFYATAKSLHDHLIKIAHSDSNTAAYNGGSVLSDTCFCSNGMRPSFIFTHSIRSKRTTCPWNIFQGRALTNAIGNLDIQDAYIDALNKLGHELEEVVEQEKDAALGNGGLGRLASCFLDSMATLNLPAWGCGLRYRIEATIFLVQCITLGEKSWVCHSGLSFPDLDGMKLEAWDVTTRTISYTDHTVLPEALEKWSQAVMWKLLPRHMEIIEYKRVNGVAQLHSDILKAELFADYVSVWPTNFQNKANGITPCRWLRFCSPELSNIITKWLETDQWVTNLDLLSMYLRRF